MTWLLPSRDLLTRLCAGVVARLGSTRTSPRPYLYPLPDTLTTSWLTFGSLPLRGLVRLRLNTGWCRATPSRFMTFVLDITQHCYRTTLPRARALHQHPPLPTFRSPTLVYDAVLVVVTYTLAFAAGSRTLHAWVAYACVCRGRAVMVCTVHYHATLPFVLGLPSRCSAYRDTRFPSFVARVLHVLLRALRSRRTRFALLTCLFTCPRSVYSTFYHSA